MTRKKRAKASPQKPPSRKTDINILVIPDARCLELQEGGRKMRTAAKKKLDDTETRPMTVDDFLALKNKKPLTDKEWLMQQVERLDRMTDEMDVRLSNLEEALAEFKHDADSTIHELKHELHELSETAGEE
jgi:hypothetical protein